MSLLCRFALHGKTGLVLASGLRIRAGWMRRLVLPMRRLADNTNIGRGLTEGDARSAEILRQ